MDQYERYVIRLYAQRTLAARAASPWARNRRPNGAVAGWLYEHAQLIGCKEPHEVDYDNIQSSHLSVDRKTWKGFGSLVVSLKAHRDAPKASGLERRLTWLCELLELSVADAEILKVATRSCLNKAVEALANSAEEASRGQISSTALAALSGLSPHMTRRRLARCEPLRLLGLLESKGSDDWTPSDTVMRIARERTVSSQRLHRSLTGRPAKAQLGWQDFGHLGAHRDLAERLLDASLEGREKGINLLFYGAPGTGKSEFARTLAARVKATSVFVGEVSDTESEPSRSARIATFAVLRALTGWTGRTILVMDEADDVFTGVDEDDAGSRIGSKVFMNRLVESTVAPTVWITNHPERLGPAIIRRMTLAIRFPEPSRDVRHRILKRTAHRRKLTLSAASLEALGGIPAAPAILDNAIRVTKLTDGGEADASLTANAILHAIGGMSVSEIPIPEIAFDPLLSAADQDLHQLTERLVLRRNLAVSFCFQGLPGTGKSAYARYLATRLGLDVVEKRGSDLLSCWVGDTEKAIARAFEEAADSRAMLILDDADSLLHDRAAAHTSWEISQVNELLSWMERHVHPLVCTTNLIHNIDPATLRRFTFKVKFLPMTVGQVREAYCRIFGGPAPLLLDALTPLTPGDFSVVARKVQILGETQSDAIVQMLAEEVAAKPGGQRTKIGFG